MKDGRFSQDIEERKQSILARYHAIDPNNRGIIVVDTCALFSLAGKTCNKHYFDTLAFLSQHGYKIVIPDMVAFEATQVLPNGKCIERYFEHNKNKGHPGLVHFIETIAAGKYPNITIARTEEPAAIRNFIERLVEITNKNVRAPEKRQLIIDHQSNNRDRKNWGDNSIREMVKALPPSPPVHVLTQDYQFLSELGQSMPALNVLTSSGLLMDIVESGLSKAIPFVDSYANSNDVISSCNQSLIDQGYADWTSLTFLDVSMAVVHAKPMVPHDVPMNLSLSHAARNLGYDRPRETSIFEKDILTEDEEESLRIRKQRNARHAVRKHLKGGVDDKSEGNGWIRQ